MSDPNKVQPINSKTTPNQIIVEGKINQTEMHKQKHYTEVILPAADAFSHPSTVKVVSTAPLGNVGQSITVECTLRGFVRTFQIQKGNRAGQQGREVSTWLVPVGDIG